MKKIFSLFAALLMVGSMWAGEVLYTFDTDSASLKGTNTSYTGNEDIEIEDITWNVAGNLSMLPWRIGGKSLTKVDRAVYMKTAYPDALDSIILKLGSNTLTSLDSIRLVYSANADFSAADTMVATVPAAFPANIKFAKDGGFAANLYYKFILTCTAPSSGNKYIQFVGVDFWGVKRAVAVEKPVFSVAAGEYYDAQSLELSCATEGAEIHYTLDGSDPTAQSATYASALTISQTTTVKAIAVKGADSSAVVAKDYKIAIKYASLADLYDVATDGQKVIVTLTNENIDSIYVTAAGKRNGIYLTANSHVVEIFCYDVPDTWVAGGKVSGDVKGTWKAYKELKEVCPSNWDDLTYTAPEPTPTTEMESLIQFTETASAGDLNGQTLGTGFTLAVTDTGSKISVDGNSALFGTSAADTIRFAYRMKTGGKSSATNCLTLTVPVDGKLLIYARTGSNSATDRNIVVANGEDTVINKILLEADTIVGQIEGKRVYLPVSADVKAGTYALTYPIGSVNFYGFKLDTAKVEPEPEPVAATDIYVMGIASWSAADAYKMTETVTGSEWTYDFGTTELVGKTFKFATADWSTVDLGSSEGLKEGTIALTQGGANISVASNYSSATNVVVTLKKDAEGNWTVTAAGTFVEGTPAIPDLYLRGINGSWDATDANKFTKAENENKWTLTIAVTASNEFKVADANWGSYNFGGDGSTAVVPGTAYTLVNGGSNMWLENTPASGNYTFTVVKEGDAWTLTVNKNTTALDEINAKNGIQKFIENGHMYILKNGIRYDAAGKIVK